MTPLMILGLTAVMLGTAFLSGIFGMAGGMILMGVLLAVMPLPAAMALHAVTQMASNAWRAVLWWQHIRWRPVAYFLVGNLAALAVWSVFQWVPEKAVALLMLGATPFLFRLLPARIKPNPLHPAHGATMGAVCMSLMLVCGVSGPAAGHVLPGRRHGAAADCGDQGGVPGGRASVQAVVFRRPGI
jgi:uncharacterized membrane protein YfcA